ncbi:MAG: Hsp20/alpha crystallin family protein, partial [Candidatus Pacebacteria bacterium]|nr:Hsp20/alpha crystallin family protein [Candidatus Paceibacterota bacterium]
LTVDVYKTKDLIVIKSIIGGVRPEDLDVSITSDMVTIKGKRNNPDNVVSDDYYYQECFWGNFSRSIILPNDIKTEGVEAMIKNGILTIKLPKIEKNSSMKIEVKSE